MVGIILQTFIFAVCIAAVVLYYQCTFGVCCW